MTTEAHGIGIQNPPEVHENKNLSPKGSWELKWSSQYNGAWGVSGPNTSSPLTLCSPALAYGLFVGGRFQAPEAQHSRPIQDSSGKLYSRVAEGGAKDVQGAVEAAHRAAPG